ncbi:hypothetical protein QE152_g24979 [Popillia japonica]|uniref:Uncharacterized protein n=1 Tax=Popillia japonica TaxID=7064 RepID=A0AAW1K397_POPJA
MRAHAGGGTEYKIYLTAYEERLLSLMGSKALQGDENIPEIGIRTNLSCSLEDAPTISANNVKVCNAWQEQSYTLSSNDTTKNINNTLQTPTESTSAVMTKKGKAEYSSKVLRNSNTNLTSINANIGEQSDSEFDCPSDGGDDYCKSCSSESDVSNDAILPEHAQTEGIVNDICLDRLPTATNMSVFPFTKNECLLVQPIGNTPIDYFNLLLTQDFLQEIEMKPSLKTYKLNIAMEKNNDKLLNIQEKENEEKSAKNTENELEIGEPCEEQTHTSKHQEDEREIEEPCEEETHTSKTNNTKHVPQSIRKTKGRSKNLAKKKHIRQRQIIRSMFLYRRAIVR